MRKISQFFMIAAVLVSSFWMGEKASFADTTSQESCTLQDSKPLQAGVSSSSRIPELRTLTLMKEEDLYDEVFGGSTAGSISPQTVDVVDRKVIIKLDGERTSWYKIRTWLGDKWVQSNSAIPGDQHDVKMNMLLTGEEKLYTFNAGFMESSATISPQDVTVKAVRQNYYRIDTWLGDRWIAPAHRVWTNIQKIDVLLPLAEGTELFTLPDEGCSTNTYLDVKTAYAFERVSDWLHIKTNRGTF